MDGGYDKPNRTWFQEAQNHQKQWLWIAFTEMTMGFRSPSFHRNPWIQSMAKSGLNNQKWFFLWRFIKKAMDFCVFKARKMSKILSKKMAAGPLGLQCPSHLKLFLEPANQMALHHLGAAKVPPKKTHEKRSPRMVSRSVCWSIIPSILVIIYSSWL